MPTGTRMSRAKDIDLWFKSNILCGKSYAVVKGVEVAGQFFLFKMEIN